MTLSDLLSARTETQAVLADLIGCHQTTVGGWLRGDSLPPRTRIPAIAKALDLPVDVVRDAVAASRAQNACPQPAEAQS
jgi:transcriptional regulator with XRE-family HTH domain